MKRALAAALVLLLCLTARAERAYGTLNGQRIFFVEYDENAFTLDTTGYAHENEERFRFHFQLKSEKNDVMCCMEYLPEYRDFSSFSATEEEFRDYISGFDYAEEGLRYEYRETYRVRVRNGSREAFLPFVIVKVDEGREKSWYAETVSHGWAVYIEAYNNVSRAADESDLILLKSILDSFTPISGGK